MFIFCEECQKEKEFFIIDMKEGDDCWQLVTLECSDCGKTKVIKLYK